MLKWAVNGSRQTGLQNEDKNMEHSVNPSSQLQGKRLKRKSFDLSLQRSKTPCNDKENQYTSTPLQTSSSRLLKSPSYKTDSFKDLSNILPALAYNSPLKLPGGKESYKIENTQLRKSVPSNYTSTLPTFDVEYSPSALIPGPMLALRGVGVPDSYFKKPRYITPHSQEDVHNVSEQLNLETKTLRNSVESILKYPAYMEESTLSSTKMGDVTLECMIDAILESNRKVRKPPKSFRQPQQPHLTMSPTYTPAEDPASDLHEVWDSEKSRYRPKKQKLKTKLTKKFTLNEREICSPQLQENLDPGQLRRQRGLRRKRKINQITASVMTSAQKLLGKGVHNQTLCKTSNNLRKVFESKINHKEIHPRKLQRNISPDSGHNSSSDYEENDCNLHECMADDNKILDSKRRLSFSL